MKVKVKVKEKIESNKLKIMNILGKDSQLFLNIIIIILINIAGITLNVRFDLTKNNTYSISEKSKKIVSGLKENLKIRVLFSKDLPAEHSTLFRYLKDLLNEYEYYGNEFFDYEIVDGEKVREQAADFGIRPVTSNEFVNDQIKTRQTYMGLVIQHADLIEKIDAITNPVGLEYEITSKIEKISGKINGLLNLKKPILLKLYLDHRLKQLPITGIKDLDKKVIAAVEKSNRNNYGKIKFVLVDSSQNESGDIAEKYGLNKLKWPELKTKSGEKLEAGEGFFGIVIESGKNFQKINLNIGQSLFGNYIIAGLEKFDEKINDAISNIFNANEKIGYITGHGIVNLMDEQSRQGGALFKKLLSDVYDIKNIDLSKETIPENINTIIINGPKEKLSDSELFKIDQFLMMGKSAIFFVDSYREVQMQGRQNPFQRRQPIILPLMTGIGDMLKHYGITVNKDVVLDKNSAKVNLGNTIKEYPLVPIIRKKGLPENNIITKYLQSLLFMKAASLSADDEKLKKSGIEKINLVTSSDESWLMKGRINYHPLYMNSGMAKEMKSYNLAAMLSGKFISYFKNREVTETEVKGKDKDKASAKTGSIKSIKKLDSTVDSGKTRIIVVGTSEITQSGFLMYSRKILSSGNRNEVYSNDHFLHSLVDSLENKGYIPEMKSKSLEYNPLKKTSDKKRFGFKLVNIAGVPVLIIIFGFVAWRNRLSRRKKILIEFSGESNNE